MYIVFDIGGSRMRVAASEDGTTLGEPIIHPTPENFKEGMSLLGKSIKTLAKKHAISHICGGIAGVVDYKSAKVLVSPNLRNWENHSLAEALSKFCPTVFLENDAALAGLAEAIHGAGMGNEIVGYITVGTGIGGVRIVQEMIDLRRVGFEPGQQIIDPETLNSLGSLVSGKAIERKYHKEPKLIDDPLIWKKTAEYFAIGLHNTILHWSPDVIVLGGPMILNKPGIDIDEVEKFLKSIMIMFPDLPQLKKAELGENNTMLGALEYIKQNSSGERQVIF